MNLKNKIKSILVIGLVTLHCLPSLSQVQHNLDRNHNEEVTIIGTYDPSISDAFKINIKPEVKPLSFSKPEFTFLPLTSSLSTSITLDPIIPVSIKADEQATVYDNYLLAGFGSLLSPCLDFTHSHGEKNDYRLTFQLNSLSSFLNIPNYAPSTYSNNQVNLQFSHFLTNHEFTSGLKYGLNTNKYYGFIPSDYTNPEQFYQNQVFNLIEANLGIKSTYRKDNMLNHSFDLLAYYYFDKYKSSESNILFDFEVSKKISVTKSLNYQYFGLEAIGNFYGNRDSVSSSNNFLITAIPYFKARYGILDFKIGINLNYLLSNENKFRIYPLLELSVNAVPELMTVYFKLGGGLTRNSYLGLSTANPWVISTLPLDWRNDVIAISAGVRGSIARQVNYNLEMEWMNFENDFFFMNTSDISGILQFDPPMNKFTVAYDNGNLFKVGGELAYVFSQDFKLWIGAKYNSYSLDSLAKPYQKPLTMIQFGASYLVKKKLNLRAELYSYGKRYALDNLYQETTMKGFFDLNFAAEYFLTEKFSVFLSLTNLLNQHYFKYYNYPVQGFQVMAGVGYKF